jgi:SET domain
MCDTPSPRSLWVSSCKPRSACCSCRYQAKWAIDAKHAGGVGRFVNHSRAPNLFIQVSTVHTSVPMLSAMVESSYPAEIISTWVLPRLVRPYKLGVCDIDIVLTCASASGLQPVLSRHHDQDLTYQAFFASYNIPAFTLLTFDYGDSYVETQLDGKCLCGAEACYSKRPAE